MIVKDEEKDIERCLKSVYKYIDYWVIIDTGSKDKTIKKIKSLMKNRFKVPGELHERPWVDFSHNRNEALEIAETKADYVMFMDADDIFKPEKGFNLDFLLSDYLGFNVLFKLDGTSFERTVFVSSRAGFRYEGVLHESLILEGFDNHSHLLGVALFCEMEANASPLKRASTKKEKYLNDVKVIQDSLKKDPSNTRSQFYLAQSYACAEMPEEAIAEYEKRIEMGGWEQEIYVSMYRLAALRMQVTQDINQFISDLSRAWEFAPYRYEAAAALMDCLVKEGRNSMAFSIGDMTVKFQRVMGSLGGFFDVDDAASYVFPKNYAISAEKCGFNQIALQSLKLLLETGGDNIKPKELEKKIKELEIKIKENE